MKTGLLTYNKEVFVIHSFPAFQGEKPKMKTSCEMLITFGNTQFCVLGLVRFLSLWNVLALVTDPDDLSSMRRIHLVEEENWLLWLIIWTPHVLSLG